MHKKKKGREKKEEGKGIEVIPEEKDEQGEEYDLKSGEDRMLGWKREQKLRGKASKMHN